MKLTTEQLQDMKRFVSDRDIVVLAALIDKGTQVKAAKALGITQGTLSARLKRIVRDAQGMGWMPDFGSHNKLPGEGLVSKPKLEPPLPEGGDWLAAGGGEPGCGRCAGFSGTGDNAELSTRIDQEPAVMEGVPDKK